MRRTVKEFREAKGKRLVYLTAYDYPTARLAEAAGVDALLVGDSLGMVVLGYPSTVPVTLEEILHHTKAVRRGAPDTFVVADLPYLSYATLDRALRAAERLLKEGGADAVKLEGGEEVAEVVAGLTRAGVPVLGHVGLTPQTASQLGGYRLQGRRPEEAERILRGALALEAAGAYGVVLEMVPALLAKEITERLSVPTIGIGAGPHTDAQILVFHDVVGLYEAFKPRFAKRYLEGGRLIQEALARYAQEVREGLFPGEEHSF
ncbi:MAG: 3-methyl-2-oxobutanoate hydroxymethyltransferase [Thermus sp.]|uniref:3-methyl-2-oxobutanoate hydroxymethyltransferase n=1 Tax=unclassified Thermus TaxID=2619321 RepID=UPI00059E5703|nr:MULTISPECIES: 3-methyl-2-oxobutanoate hydroxymethyltransferase [unclassified Thermus]MCS7218911.1 3-methyl-2-oxobutanoate hydroxymethyltransferase [Thermus sp.]MCX7849750.1 3-methyl-2-oxobutanoate hydroxymethyltransferase [Thermus sp.]MDW8016372.1 3-methyl-2-oxobutanoate hydroxymethyltransferase [Thermus sp.]